jgi:OOP family OmpA-OmpF porin
MKKLLLILIAVTANIAAAQTNNWVNAAGNPWKNGAGQCWRNSAWTPATAHADCDGAVRAEAPVPAAAPRVSATFVPPVAKAPEVVQPVATKVVYNADTFFDFDKSVIKAEGKAKLDLLASRLNSMTLEVVIVVGHTDSIGTDAYNIKLGERRANAVRAYMLTKGVDKNRVYTDSKGEHQPIADNRTAVGRAKNRRVEIEIVGTSK